MLFQPTKEKKKRLTQISQGKRAAPAKERAKTAKTKSDAKKAKDTARQKTSISQGKRGGGKPPGNVTTKSSDKAEKRKQMRRKRKLAQDSKSTGAKKKKTKKPSLMERLSQKNVELKEDIARAKARRIAAAGKQPLGSRLKKQIKKKKKRKSSNGTIKQG